jgi:Spy/CpxP family protein refolding chaperone
MKPISIALALIMCAANLGAQVAGTPAPKPMPQQPGGDAFAQCLFPPELVMMHQRDIGLQDAQRTKLIAEMSQAQAKFTEVQWTLSGEQQKLEQLLKGATVDETAVLKQVDRILSLEQDLKRSQMTLMVRVKNTLTPQQQSALSAFRPRSFARNKEPLIIVDGNVQPPPGPGSAGYRIGYPGGAPPDCG